jgi:hypothetical protein
MLHEHLQGSLSLLLQVSTGLEEVHNSVAYCAVRVCGGMADYFALLAMTLDEFESKLPTHHPCGPLQCRESHVAILWVEQAADLTPARLHLRGEAAA